jgi:hypothetical protein
LLWLVPLDWHDPLFLQVDSLSFHLVQISPVRSTLDLSTISRHTGTEVSGFLGFAMLRQLELKLDYRDGLVDFEYDPKRLPFAR